MLGLQTLHCAWLWLSCRCRGSNSCLQSKCCPSLFPSPWHLGFYSPYFLRTQVIPGTFYILQCFAPLLSFTATPLTVVSFPRLESSLVSYLLFHSQKVIIRIIFYIDLVTEWLVGHILWQLKVICKFNLSPNPLHIVSGQRLTCLSSSLEKHLGNLEEKSGGLGGDLRDRAKQRES